MGKFLPAFTLNLIKSIRAVIQTDKNPNKWESESNCIKPTLPKLKFSIASPQTKETPNNKEIITPQCPVKLNKPTTTNRNFNINTEENSGN
jgi:hypothetical protein